MQQTEIAEQLPVTQLNTLKTVGQTLINVD